LIALGGFVLALAALFGGAAIGQKTIAIAGMSAGVIVTICSLMMLGIFWFAGWMEQRGIRALLEGERWAQWRYGDDEWRRFTDAEWARDAARSKRIPLTAFFSLLVGGVFVGWSRGDLALGLEIGLGAGVPLALLVGAIAYGLASATRKRRQRGPGEAFIGPSGVYQDGHFVGWSGINGPLESAKLLPSAGDAPAVVQFIIRGRRGTNATVRVLVPQAEQQAAAELVARFAKP
jgi:hypothetical protein